MSFQAYLENIKAKTGKTAEDFIALAKEKRLLEPGVKTGEIVAWLKADFSLGQGHAMAIVNVIKQANEPQANQGEKVAKHFAGAKSVWRRSYEDLISELNKLGADVKIAPTSSYISLLRGNKKFGIVKVSADRMEIGIKLKDAEPVGRFEAAGNWNAMVTHRVQVTEHAQIDSELISWLQKAYDKQ